MESEIGSGKGIVRPHIRVSTIKTQRVAIVAIDINGAVAGTRSRKTLRSGVIAHERYDNTIVSEHIFDCLKICLVREGPHRRNCKAILILWLEQDNRTAITTQVSLRFTPGASLT